MPQGPSIRKQKYIVWTKDDPTMYQTFETMREMEEHFDVHHTTIYKYMLRSIEEEYGVGKVKESCGVIGKEKESDGCLSDYYIREIDHKGIMRYHRSFIEKEREAVLDANVQIGGLCEVISQQRQEINQYRKRLKLPVKNRKPFNIKISNDTEENVISFT